MTDPTYSIGLIVEAQADATLVTTLVDRCLHERIEWLDEGILDHIRGWRGLEPETPFTKWTDAKALAIHHRVMKAGFFDGHPGKPDARIARNALLLFAKLGLPDLIVLVRDADDQPERKERLDQARHSTPQPLANLLGGDLDREPRCLTEPPLSELRQRGKHTGLAVFLDEVEERIVPVIDAGTRRPADG